MKRIWQRLTMRRFVAPLIYFLDSAEFDITSTSVAYYLLIAIFPILLLLAALLPYLQIDIGQILEVTQVLFPEKVYPTAERIIRTMLTRPSGVWIGFLVFSVLLTFTRATHVLQKAFNKAYSNPYHRGVIRSSFLGISLGLTIQILLTVSITIFAVGGQVLRYLADQHIINKELSTVLEHSTLPVVLLVMVLGLLLVYYFLPNVRITKIRYVLPGTIFVISVLALLGNIFRLYLERYAERFVDIRWVTVIVILILVLWFMFLANILIIGACLNATYQSVYDDIFVTRRGRGERILVGKRIRAFLRKQEQILDRNRKKQSFDHQEALDYGVEDVKDIQDSSALTLEELGYSKNSTQKEDLN